LMYRNRDVAVVNHYMFRSTEEHLQKRMRGDVFFGDREDRKDWIEKAKQGLDPWTGKPLPEGTVPDNTAWEALKRLDPRYEDYEINRSRISPASCGEAPRVTRPRPNTESESKSGLIPRNGDTAAICVVTKDDTFYVNEWTDYHLALGFSDIYIFDHSENKQLLKEWASRRNKDQIHVAHITGENIRVSAYRGCFDVLKQMKHTWAMFADMDKFLVLKQSTHVVDFARKHVNKSNRGINWKVFGTSGHKKYEALPVLKRFPCRLSYFFPESLRFTSFVRVDQLGNKWDISETRRIPQMEGTFIYDTGGRRIVKQQHNGPRDVAVMHQYRFLSEEEYRRKHHGRTSYDEDQKPLPTGCIRDISAWEILKEKMEYYQKYDVAQSNEEPICGLCGNEGS